MASDTDAWPDLLSDLLAEYGQAAVWRAGLESLEFPPTWATDSSEYATIRTRLTATH